VDPVAGEAGKTGLLRVASDAVPHLAETGQFFDVDVNQVARQLSFITLHHSLELQVAQPPQAKAAQGLLATVEKGAAASIKQSSDTTGAVPSKSLVRGAEADSHLPRQISQELSDLVVLTHKPCPTDSCQSGVEVGIHGL